MAVRRGNRAMLTHPDAVAPGSVVAARSFCCGLHLPRTVWVIAGGEWGFERPGASRTTDAGPDLWQLVREHLKG